MSALTLQVGPPTEGACSDPAISGETAEVVDTPISGDGDFTDDVAIAVSDGSGQASTGPVVMTYSQGSTSKLVTTSAGGWLWVYDNSTTAGSELLQVSAATGQVEDSIRAPNLVRPVLVANDAGLWMGNSISGSSGLPSPSLYYVAPGASAAVPVLTGSAVCWMVASGEHLWAAVPVSEESACQEQVIDGFEGSDLQPVTAAALQGFQPPWVVNSEVVAVADQADQLWTASFVASRNEIQVIRIDPGSGAEAVLATAPGPPDGLAWPSYYSPLGPPGASLQAVALDGSFFLLEPADISQAFAGTLLRVTPADATTPLQ